ncbi:hypothetical protein [Sedimentitalea nanhaiensis]|uniref:FecR family protein n=1 Tax=Sedimentitalea nanhaiensis TaxID=999627 RepID=A0A1I7EBC7_9RHOB|nr:hypothetical protein [Sedimentitalea nanhaiensis]SFU21256.1 hypothetical protein SAMN05216236_15910 [Sedimentitalea nanhaiensis]
MQNSSPSRTEIKRLNLFQIVSYTLAALILVVSSLAIASQASWASTINQATPSCPSSKQFASSLEETIELVYPDGASVVLGPNSSASVSCVSGGAITIDLQTGLIRVAGGLGNVDQPILVNTPNGKVRLENGTAVVGVQDGVTRANLVNGTRLVVTSDGTSREIYRPGFQVTTASGRPSKAKRLTEEEVLADQRGLYPSLASGVAPRTYQSLSIGTRSLPVASNERDDDADETQSEAKFVAKIGAEDSELRNTPNDDSPEPEPPNPPEPEPAAFGEGLGTLNLAGSFQPSLGRTVNAISEDTSGVSDGEFILEQAQPATGRRSRVGGVLSTRSFGPTAISVFGGSDLVASAEDYDSLSVSISAGPYYYVSGTGSQYGLANPDNLSVADFMIDPASFRSDFTFSGNNSFHFSSSFSWAESNFGRYGEVSGKDFESIETSIEVTDNDIYGYPYGYPDTRNVRVTLKRGYGAEVERTIFGIDLASIGDDREPDNFFYLSAQPRPAFTITCDDPTGCFPVKDILESTPTEDLTPDQITILAYFNSPNAKPFFPKRIETGGISEENDRFVAYQYYGFTGTRLEDRLIFATGDLDGLKDPSSSMPGHSIDRFTVHASDGVARAFLRNETWTNLDRRSAGSFDLAVKDLTSTDLFVLNPFIDTVADPSASILDGVHTSKVLQADFGLANSDGAQVSTISATIGEIKFSTTSETEADARIYARTVGSSKGLNSDGSTSASVLIGGPVRSTAAGGGNPEIPGLGRLGAFVIENAGTVFDDRPDTVGTGSPEFETTVLTGGRERPLGRQYTFDNASFQDTGMTSDKDTAFAIARLALGYSKEDISKSDPMRDGFVNEEGSEQEIIGYAAAIIETEANAQEGGTNLAFFSLPDDPANLRFHGFDGAANTLKATITLADGRTIEFGGAGGKSAFKSETEYGLLSVTPGRYGEFELGDENFPDDHDMVIVSGDLVSEELVGQFETSDRKSIRAPSVSKKQGYEHIKWGFFMGDVAGTSKNGSRQHAHLGSFASGKTLSATEVQRIKDGVRPTVTYRGHMIGNVYNGGRTYTALGTYQDEFNFESRTGKISADFDRHRFEGSSGTQNSGADAFRSYSGSFRTNDSTYRGTVKGQFISPVVDGAPSGVVGRFGIQNGETIPGKAYRAIGTFGAEQIRKP